MAAPGVRWACSGCGREIPWDALPLGCPGARAGDDVDHVLGRVAAPGALRFPTADEGRGEKNPFVRYRRLLAPWHVAQAAGMADEDYVALVRRLDEAVGAVEGRSHGFVVTPLDRRDDLGAWAKDETGSVSGSHKARHLFGVLVHIEVLEAIGRGGDLARRPLAIASCGNAALAAAVVARAARRTLRVFIPTDAHPNVVARLRALGAEVEICPRLDGQRGDPTYQGFKAAVDGGALPFCCQGPDCGATIDGGRTLGYEIVEQLGEIGAAPDDVLVQVGGGALGSAVAQALAEAVQHGVLTMQPRVHFVQTKGAFPLQRAYETIRNEIIADLAAVAPAVHLGDPVATAAVTARLRDAARRRSRYMWPWETAPHSVAHGILDDETYDWRALLEELFRGGGEALVVDEETLVEANRAANANRARGAFAVDETGTAGLAGLMALRRAGRIAGSARAVVLFTGARR